MPIFTFVLGKMGFITADMLMGCRAYAFVIIMVIAAIITPPDIFTLMLVAFPIYGLYEVSILVWGKCVKKNDEESEEEESA